MSYFSRLVAYGQTDAGLPSTITPGTTTTTVLPSSLVIHAGNSVTGTALNQVLLQGTTTNNAHAIKTRHNAAGTSDNAIDLFIWQYGTDTATTVGSRQALTIAQTGVGINQPYPTSALQVGGTITATGDIICNNLSAGNLGMFKNRLINGDMRIDQRYYGTLVSNASSYVTDRWVITAAGGTVSAQTIPLVGTLSLAGFQSGLQVVTTGAGTLTSTNFCVVQQNIEGYNTSDFNCGSSTAIPLVFSAWCLTSLVGTYSVGLRNGNFSGTTTGIGLPFSIGTASQWTRVSCVIPACTIGNWGSSSVTGLAVSVGLTVGSNYTSTVTAWSANNIFGSPNNVNFMATAGNTLVLTGMQLEKGYMPTPFDYRPFAVEYQLCQRYYEQSSPYGLPPILYNTYFTSQKNTVSYHGASDFYVINVSYSVEKRATPTFQFFGGSNPSSPGLGTMVIAYYGVSNVQFTPANMSGAVSQTGAIYQFATGQGGNYATSGTGTTVLLGWTANAEL